MPTPAGHAIGGLAAAFLTNAAARRPRLTIAVVLSSIALAMAPDLDIIAGWHRAHTHSIAAIGAVGLITWLVLRTRTTDALPPTMALTAAFASHSVLDLLGKDTSPPPGLMVLWPFSRAYYQTGWDVFGEVSRRYWLPREFILGNLWAVAWEVAVLAPLLFIAWAFWSKRTLARKPE